MDNNMNPNVPGSTPGTGSDPMGQGQMPDAGVPVQQPDPVQPPVEQPQVPSEPPVPQPEQPSSDQGQVNPDPAVGA